MKIMTHNTAHHQEASNKVISKAGILMCLNLVKLENDNFAVKNYQNYK